MARGQSVLQILRGEQARQRAKYLAKKNYKLKKSLRKWGRFKRAVRGMKGSAASIGLMGPNYSTVKAWDKGPNRNLAMSYRRAAKYYGDGDYKDILKWGSRAIGGLAGGALGAMSGLGGWNAVKDGALSGWDKGADFSRWAGWGDYGGSAGGNQIMAGSVDTPITVNASDTDLSGDIYLSHREFLQNVTATGGSGNISQYSYASFPLNPGLQQTFPWLSQIAQNFTMYELIGTIFEFRPTSGEFGGTGTNALGKVVMATQYDPDAAPFVNTIEMENYDYANACKPSEHMLHGVETKASQRLTNLLYIRTGNDSKKPLTLTDIGTFYIATEGLPVTSGTTANVGELWVTYRVKLSRAALHGALLNNNILGDVAYAAASASAIAGQTSTDLVSQSWAAKYNPPAEANGFAYKKTNTLGCRIVGSSNLTTINIQFPVNIVYGTYEVRLFISNAVNGAYNIASTAFFQNCQLLQISGIDVVSPYINIAAVATTSNAMAVFHVKVQAPGDKIASFSIQTSANLAQGALSFIQIMEYPSNFE